MGFRLELGKQYVRRNGTVSGPLQSSGNTRARFYDDGHTYYESGAAYEHFETLSDLIRLATPEEIAAGRATLEPIEEGEGMRPNFDTERGHIERLRDMVKGQNQHIEDLEKEIARLLSETQALRAELETLKPKPVVVTRYIECGNGSYCFRGFEPHPQANLKLTFHDGALVTAEVIK